MSKEFSKGTIEHGVGSERPTDYLYRISLKALVRNEQGEVLVVKEASRTYWDLPGGGMDHGETIGSALARELHEEANFKGEFTWRIITVDEPKYAENHDFWQVRLIIEVTPDNLEFSVGEDATEIAFVDPTLLKGSPEKVERWIYAYATYL